MIKWLIGADVAGVAVFIGALAGFVKPTFGTRPARPAHRRRLGRPSVRRVLGRQVPRSGGGAHSRSRAPGTEAQQRMGMTLEFPGVVA